MQPLLDDDALWFGIREGDVERPSCTRSFIFLASRVKASADKGGDVLQPGGQQMNFCNLLTVKTTQSFPKRIMNTMLVPASPPSPIGICTFRYPLCLSVYAFNRDAYPHQFSAEKDGKFNFMVFGSKDTERKSFFQAWISATPFSSAWKYCHGNSHTS